MSLEIRRGRGRPRGFEEAVVLDKALQAFWNAGYEATSLDDLSAATGLARASLYAAFKDKEGLYLKTLDRFVARMAADFEAAFAAGRPLSEALADFYLRAIGIYFEGESPRGCLVVCTASPVAVTQPEVRAALAATLRAMERAFAGVFRRAQSRGEATAADPALLGALAAAAQQSIAVRARAGEDRGRLETFAHETASLLAR